MATTFDAESLSSYSVINGVPTQSPAAARTPGLDIVYNCESNDNQGVLISVGEMSGGIPFVDFNATITSTGSMSGTPHYGLVFTGTLISFGTISGESLLEGSRRNWVKWTDADVNDFTIQRGSLAGERPLGWKGLIYAVKKLNKAVIAYGENGVSVLERQPIPLAEGNWNLNIIYRIGLKGKNSVTGDNDTHWFIDNIGQLWELGGKGLKKLDYSEYLIALDNNLVMSYDNLNNLIYICDCDLGFVYNPLTESLGRGPTEITGIGAQGGILYVAAADFIESLPFEFCTDRYDFGTRSFKTIHSLEIGTDLESKLFAAIDYKRSIDTDFIRTPWIRVPEKGEVFITAFGREFRIRLRTETYEWFTLNYIKINGIIHGHNSRNSAREVST